MTDHDEYAEGFAAGLLAVYTKAALGGSVRDLLAASDAGEEAYDAAPWFDPPGFAALEMALREIGAAPAVIEAARADYAAAGWPAETEAAG